LHSHSLERGPKRLVIEAGRKAVLLPGNIAEHSVSAAGARKAINAFGAIEILVEQRRFPANLR
jgi:hypothetical protein